MRLRSERRGDPRVVSLSGLEADVVELAARRQLLRESRDVTYVTRAEYELDAAVLFAVALQPCASWIPRRRLGRGCENAHDSRECARAVSGRRRCGYRSRRSGWQRSDNNARRRYAEGRRIGGAA